MLLDLDQGCPAQQSQRCAARMMPSGLSSNTSSDASAGFTDVEHTVTSNVTSVRYDLTTVAKLSCSNWPRATGAPFRIRETLGHRSQRCVAGDTQPTSRVRKSELGFVACTT